MNPITRDEQFLARAAGNENAEYLTPITREEHFLQDIIDNIESGGGGGFDAFDAEQYDSKYCKITFPEGKNYATDPALAGKPFGLKAVNTINVCCVTSQGTTKTVAVCTGAEYGVIFLKPYQNSTTVFLAYTDTVNNAPLYDFAFDTLPSYLVTTAEIPTSDTDGKIPMYSEDDEYAVWSTPREVLETADLAAIPLPNDTPSGVPGAYPYVTDNGSKLQWQYDLSPGCDTIVISPEVCAAIELVLNGLFTAAGSSANGEASGYTLYNYSVVGGFLDAVYESTFVAADDSVIKMLKTPYIVMYLPTSARYLFMPCTGLDSNYLGYTAAKFSGVFTEVASSVPTQYDIDLTWIVFGDGAYDACVIANVKKHQPTQLSLS